MVWEKNVGPLKGALRAIKRIAWLPLTVTDDERGVEIWIWLEPYLSLEENILVTDDGMTCFLHWQPQHEFYLGDAVDIVNEIDYLVDKYKWGKS